jgi:hypothetical protein
VSIVLLLKYQTDEYGIKDEIGGNEQTFEFLWQIIE